MLKISCPCGHTGITDARLPRVLTCSRCGLCRYVEAEDGARIVNRVAFEEWLFGEHEAAGAIALARPRRDDG
jgi:hypothetical protein